MTNQIFWVNKNSLKMPQIVNLANLFLITEPYCQTVLRDRSVLVEQKSPENAKKVQFSEFLKTRSMWLNSVTSQVSFNRANIAGKCQKMIQFIEFLKTWSLLSNSVTRQVSLKAQKSVENAKIEKFEMRHFE